MYNYEIDDAIESVIDDMDDYDYDYDDTDAFCDALESMVYDMADYLCYEKGYSEDEALEAANVYYGCALETSSQIKQVRNQARKTYNKAQKAAKRGDTYTAKQLSAQAKNLDKKVHAAKNRVDTAVHASNQQFEKRLDQHTAAQSQKPGYTNRGYAKSSNLVVPKRSKYGTPYRERYVDSTTRDFMNNEERGDFRSLRKDYRDHLGSEPNRKNMRWGMYK